MSLKLCIVLGWALPKAQSELRICDRTDVGVILGLGEQRSRDNPRMHLEPLTRCESLRSDRPLYLEMESVSTPYPYDSGTSRV